MSCEIWELEVWWNIEILTVAVSLVAHTQTNARKISMQITGAQLIWCHEGKISICLLSPLPVVQAF